MVGSKAQNWAGSKAEARAVMKAGSRELRSAETKAKDVQIQTRHGTYKVDHTRANVIQEPMLQKLLHT